MVTKERKYVAIEEAKRIITESKTPEEAVGKLHSLHKRQPRPPAPEGGISLRAAARKYGLDNGTLSRWVSRGWVSIITRTPNWLYIDECNLIRVVRERRNNKDN